MHILEVAFFLNVNFQTGWQSRGRDRQISMQRQHNLTYPSWYTRYIEGQETHTLCIGSAAQETLTLKKPLAKWSNRGSYTPRVERGPVRQTVWFSGHLLSNLTV